MRAIWLKNTFAGSMRAPSARDIHGLPLEFAASGYAAIDAPALADAWLRAMLVRGVIVPSPERMVAHARGSLTEAEAVGIVQAALREAGITIPGSEDTAALEAAATPVVAAPVIAGEDTLASSLGEAEETAPAGEAESSETPGAADGASDSAETPAPKKKKR